MTGISSKTFFKWSGNMSTRSSIGIYDERKGTVSSIYCMNDGYLEGVGATLANYYTSESEIRALLAGEDIMSLAPEPQLCPPMLDPEPACVIDEIASLEEAFEECLAGDEEYAYLYAISETGSPKWFYTKRSSRGGWTKPSRLPKNPSSFAFSTLEDAYGWLVSVLKRNDGKLEKVNIRIDYRKRGVSDKDIETVELSRSEKVNLITDSGEKIVLDRLKPFIQYRFIDRLKASKGSKLENLKRDRAHRRVNRAARYNESAELTVQSSYEMDDDEFWTAYTDKQLQVVDILKTAVPVLKLLEDVEEQSYAYDWDVRFHKELLGRLNEIIDLLESDAENLRSAYLG